MVKTKNAGLGLLCLFSFISPLKALTVQVEELYTNISIPTSPIVYGSNVLYEDFSQGTYRFYTIDIISKTKTEIRNNMTSYIFPYDFGGTHAGWITYTGGSGGGGMPVPGGNTSYKIQIINIQSKIVQDVSSDGAFKDFMAMDNQSIVWTDYRHSTTTDTFNEVYLSSITSVNPTRITSTPSYKASGDINGNLIVWQDYRNAGSNSTNADIYLFDRSGGGEREICTNSFYQDHPSVYGTYVVWQDFRNTGSDSKNADIYMLNLITNEETAVCTAPGYQAHPKIFGDYIVWHDYRNVTPQDSLNADIYLYEISTGNEIAVTNKAGYQGPPSIYEKNIVWYDYSENKIYHATIKTQSAIIQSFPKKSIAKSSSSETIRYDLLGKKMQSGKSRHTFRNKLVLQACKGGNYIKRVAD